MKVVDWTKASREERLTFMAAMLDGDVANGMMFSIARFIEAADLEGVSGKDFDAFATALLATMIGDIREAERRKCALAARGAAVAAGIKVST